MPIAVYAAAADAGADAVRQGPGAARIRRRLFGTDASGDRGGPSVRPIDRQSRGQLGQAALASIQASAPALYGYNERTREVIAKLQEALKQPETPLDVRLIQSLTQEIQRASREVAVQGAQKTDESQKTYIDPSRLPPAYRKSIEKYFQELSQQP